MNELVCLSGVDLLTDYLEDALAPDVRAAIEAHVRECPRCLAFLDGYRDTPRILRDATNVVMPADLESSLLAALRSKLGRPSA